MYILKFTQSTLETRLYKDITSSKGTKVRTITQQQPADNKFNVCSETVQYPRTAKGDRLS